MSKFRNLSATVLLIALVAFLMAGCGGGDTASAPVSTQASTTRATAGVGGTSTNRAENLIGSVVVPGDLTPNDIKRSLESRRPIVVTFYMTGPYDDYQVRSYVTSLETKYRGQVDFYNYLYSDGPRYGDLGNVLMVNSTPTVITINRQAKVQRAWTGYVDSQSIEQGIVEAMR